MLSRMRARVKARTNFYIEKSSKHPGHCKNSIKRREMHFKTKLNQKFFATKKKINNFVSKMNLIARRKKF